MHLEYCRMNYVIPFLEDSMRVSINKSRNCDQSVDFESSESTSSQLFVSSELMYRVYRVNFLYWIKQFAIFIGRLQTYFLRTGCMTGCVYFQTPRQTEPNRSLHKSVIFFSIISSTLWRKDTS